MSHVLLCPAKSNFETLFIEYIRFEKCELQWLRLENNQHGKHPVLSLSLSLFSLFFFQLNYTWNNFQWCSSICHFMGKSLLFVGCYLRYKNVCTANLQWSCSHNCILWISHTQIVITRRLNKQTFKTTIKFTFVHHRSQSLFRFFASWIPHPTSMCRAIVVFR